jgi:hypothetical protein
MARVLIETSFDGKRWTKQRVCHISNTSDIVKQTKNLKTGTYFRASDEQTGYVISKGMV